MANQERGELGVLVCERLGRDGKPEGPKKPYTLRPTFDALCNLEEIADKPIADIQAGILQGRLSGLRAVVFSMLQDVHGEEIRTLKDASRWIEKAGGADVVLEWINQVLGINAPEQTDGEHTANPPDAQGDGTGAGLSSAPAESV